MICYSLFGNIFCEENGKQRLFDTKILILKVGSVFSNINNIVILMTQTVLLTYGKPQKVLVKEIIYYFFIEPDKDTYCLMAFCITQGIYLNSVLLIMLKYLS